jgi:predicted TIM-barrel fold metal-dependent hydrolase
LGHEDHYAGRSFRHPYVSGNVPSGERVESYLAERGGYLGYDISAELLNLGDTRVAAMNATGIDMQVVSLTMPGCEGFETETAIAMTTDANDRLAEAIHAHPSRLAGFAALPTAKPATAAKELERAVTKLGFKGAMINGHVRGEFLDNQKYWVIFECAQALNVPIYLHPTIPHPDVLKAYFEGYGDLSMPAWGFAMDTCTHFLRLVFAGLFDAYPNLRMILGHLGEGLPFWIHRLNEHAQFAAKRRGLKKAPAQYLRDDLVVTTSGNFFMPAFLCTLMALGADNILFSVDWPYESNRVAMDWLNHLQITDQGKEKICHLNAERILHL